MHQAAMLPASTYNVHVRAYGGDAFARYRNICEGMKRKLVGMQEFWDSSNSFFSKCC